MTKEDQPIEKPPTCPEMARTGISTQKMPKKCPPGLKFWILEPRENTPRNAEEVPSKRVQFWYFGRLFFSIFRVFWGYFLGVQNFGPGAIFSVFFVKIPGQAIPGLSSLGRSQGYDRDNISGPSPSREMTNRNSRKRCRAGSWVHLGVPAWSLFLSKNYRDFEASPLEFWCSEEHFTQFDLILTLF